MFLLERGGFSTAPFHISMSFGITSSVHYPSPPLHLVLLLLLRAQSSFFFFLQYYKRRLLPTSYIMIKTQFAKWRANQAILHIIYYFTFFLFLVPYCIGYVSVLAWQAAEVAAKSPIQATVRLNSKLFSERKLHKIEPLKSYQEAISSLY